jgi:hypothetical protein
MKFLKLNYPINYSIEKIDGTYTLPNEAVGGITKKSFKTVKKYD